MSCVIDGSHMRASDLDYRIVAAMRPTVGDILTTDDIALMHRASTDYYRTMSELSDDDVTELRCLADSCVDRWNDLHVPMHVVAYVEDSCLWVEAME